MKKRLLCLLIALPFLAAAQTLTPSYTSTATSTNLSGVQFTFVDNTPNCLLTTSYNQFGCWHYSALNLDAGAIQYTQVATSPSLTAVLDPGGNISTFSGWVTSPHWTAQTTWGTGWHQVAIDGSGTPWVLGNLGVCGHGSAYKLYKIIGPNQFQLNHTCVNEIAIAQDGTMLAAISGRTLIESTDGGTTWTTLTFAGSPWSSISIADASTAIGIKASTISKINFLNNSLTSLPSPGTTSAVSIGPDHKVFAIASSGYVYGYNDAQNTWSQLLGGGFTSVSSGGSMNIWAVGSNSGAWVPNNMAYHSNIWTLADQGLTATTNMQGSSTCSGNCTGITTHVLNQFWWGGVAAGSPNTSYAQGSNGTPNFFMTNNQDPAIPVNVSPVYAMYDPFLCADPATAGTNCQVYQLDQLMCNGCSGGPLPPPPNCWAVWVAASLGSQGSGNGGAGVQQYFGTALETVTWDGGYGTSCSGSLFLPERCWFGTRLNCSSGPTYPSQIAALVDWAVGDDTFGWKPGIGNSNTYGWDLAVSCFRLSTSGSWHCLTSFPRINKRYTVQTVPLQPCS